jgi:hypothetical protein
MCAHSLDLFISKATHTNQLLLQSVFGGVACIAVKKISSGYLSFGVLFSANNIAPTKIKKERSPAWPNRYAKNKAEQRVARQRKF